MYRTDTKSDVSKDKLPMKHAVISSKLIKKQQNVAQRERKRVDKAFHAYTLSQDEQKSKKLQKAKRNLNTQYATVESEELSDKDDR